jgi:hypothetical protein
MLKFNEKRIKTGINMVNYYRVLFKIHQFDKIPDYSALNYHIFKNNGKACYSSLFLKYTSEKVSKDSNWMTSVYMAKPAIGADGTEFSEKHIVRWVELCKKYKLLPKEPFFKYSMERVPVCKKDKNINHIKLISTVYIDGVFQPTLYMWLDNFRHLREDQGFVMAALYLHDELGIDFYVSYIIASYFNISNTGHHSLKISKSSLYDGPPTKAPRIKRFDDNTAVVDLKLASVLYRVCNDYYEVTEKNGGTKNVLRFLQKKGDDRACSWHCNGIHYDVCKSEKDLIVSIKHLLHENIGKIVRAETEEERQSLLKMIK